eukprot:4399399-Prymnesium_polylepis.1
MPCWRVGARGSRAVARWRRRARLLELTRLGARLADHAFDRVVREREDDQAVVARVSDEQFAVMQREAARVLELRLLARQAALAAALANVGFELEALRVEDGDAVVARVGH